EVIPVLRKEFANLRPAGVPATAPLHPAARTQKGKAEAEAEGKAEAGTTREVGAEARAAD
ncbi:5,10-methylene tetrahydromethanopterin reductase, partial [Streptomyces sp. NPDC093600]